MSNLKLFGALYCLFVMPVVAQDLVLKYQHHFPQMDFFSTDHLNNFYVIAGDEIQLRTMEGALLNSYSDPMQGKIRYVDTFNPLRILLQHDAFFSVSFLDNMLNSNAPLLEPERHGFLDVQMVSNVDQDQVWMYDQSLDRLIKWQVSAEREVARSLTITQLINIELQPVRLLSRMDGVYLLIPDYGVLVFDQFGGFVRQIRVPGIGKDLQVRNRTLVYTAKGMLNKMHMDTYETYQIMLPGNPHQVRLEGRLLYCREGQDVRVYEVL